MRLALPAADIRYLPEFMSSAAADRWLQILLSELAWRRDSISLFGRRHGLPRLHCWYADSGLRYRWSGLDMEPVPWPPALMDLRSRVEGEAGVLFNSALANLYRDGNDSMGWHADDEPELGERPVIASLSLGAPRAFRLRHKAGRYEPRTIELEPGSLLLMAGDTQCNWQHSVPRRKRVADARINLTFRHTLPRHEAALAAR